MTAKNRADIQSEINSLLPTNGTGDISATDIRTTAETSKDSNLNLLETGNQTVAGTINSATISAETVRMGMSDYADDTSGAAVAVGGAGVYVPLPNDGAGAGTNKVTKVTGVGELWDTSANLFDWTDGLKLGDQVNIRLNIKVTTTSANQIVKVKMVAAIGGSPYDIDWENKYYKASGVQANIVKTSLVYMGDTNTLNNGARFEVSSDGNCTVEVIGWAIQHFVRG